MKKTLTFVPFLLLLLPVWKDCSSQKSVPSDNNMNVIDTSSKNTAFDDFLKIFEWDKDCQSGYKQVWTVILFYKDIDIDEIKTEIKEENEKMNIKDFFVVFGILFQFFSFMIYLLISIALAGFSFTKKRKTFIWLSAINLLVIISAYILYFDYSSVFYQIKFGFYLLIINSLLIFLSNFIWKKK